MDFEENLISDEGQFISIVIINCRFEKLKLKKLYIGNMIYFIISINCNQHIN